MDLSPIRKLSAEATPGPWKVHPDEPETVRDHRFTSLSGCDYDLTDTAKPIDLANAAFIVAAVNLVRRLTDEGALEVMARAMVVRIWDPTDPADTERAITGDNGAGLDFTDLAEAALSALLAEDGQ